MVTTPAAEPRTYTTTSMTRGLLGFIAQDTGLIFQEDSHGVVWAGFMVKTEELTPGAKCAQGVLGIVGGAAGLAASALSGATALERVAGAGGAVGDAVTGTIGKVSYC